MPCLRCGAQLRHFRGRSLGCCELRRRRWEFSFSISATFLARCRNRHCFSSSPSETFITEDQHRIARGCGLYWVQKVLGIEIRRFLEGDGLILPPRCGWGRWLFLNGDEPMGPPNWPPMARPELQVFLRHRKIWLPRGCPSRFSASKKPTQKWD